MTAPTIREIRETCDQVRMNIVTAVQELPTHALREWWLEQIQQATDGAERIVWERADEDSPSKLGPHFCALCGHRQVWTRVFDWGHCCYTCGPGGEGS